MKKKTIHIVIGTLLASSVVANMTTLLGETKVDNVPDEQEDKQNNNKRSYDEIREGFLGRIGRTTIDEFMNQKFKDTTKDDTDDTLRVEPNITLPTGKLVTATGLMVDIGSTEVEGDGEVESPFEDEIEELPSDEIDESQHGVSEEEPTPENIDESQHEVSDAEPTPEPQEESPIVNVDEVVEEATQELPDETPEEIHQETLEESSEVVPEDFTEGVSNELPDELPQEAPLEVQETLPDELPDELPQETPENLPEELPQEVPESLPEELPENLPEELPENLPDELPQEVPESLPEEFPQEVPENLPEELPQELPESLPDELPQDVPESLPEGLPQELPQDVPEDLPQESPENVPEGLPQELPDEVPKELPQETTQKSSQELPKENTPLKDPFTQDELQVTDLKVGDKIFGRTITKVPNINLSYRQILNMSEDERFEKAQGANELSYGANDGQVWLGAGDGVVKAFNDGEFIDMVLVNKYFINYVNADRAQHKIRELKYEPKFQKAADIRAGEMAEYGHIRYEGRPHTRPDGTKWVTVMKDTVKNYPYGLGENLLAYSVLSNPYQLTSEQYIAKTLFERWKNSQSHYENMMDSRLTRTAVSVKMTTRTGARSDNETNWVIGTQILSDGEIND